MCRFALFLVGLCLFFSVRPAPSMDDENAIRVLDALGIDIDVKESDGKKQVSSINLTSMAFLPRDRRIRIMNAIGSCRSLRHLKLGSTRIDDNFLVCLINASQLETLALSQTGITNKGLGIVGGLKSLRELRLSNTKITDLKSLSGLTSLQSLDVSYTRIAENGFKPIRDLKTLMYLDASGLEISDKGASVLLEMADLRELHVNHTMIGDEGLKRLVDLRRLRSLEMDGTRISDEGLRHVGQMMSISRLSVRATNTSAAAIQILKKTKPELVIHD